MTKKKYLEDAYDEPIVTGTIEALPGEISGWEIAPNTDETPTDTLEVAKKLSGNAASFPEENLKTLVYLTTLGIATDYGDGVWGIGPKWREFIRKQ